MSVRLKIAASLAAALLLAASRPARAEELKVAGSSSMCPLVAAVGERFRAVRPDVQVTVECGGSDRGIKAVRDGAAAIGMVARALRVEEQDLVGFPVARDGASVIVHKSNPVESLTESQLAAVFSGELATWRTLNGQDAPLAVILREPAKPITELVEKQFKVKGGLRGKVVPGDNPVTAAAVAADPGAIGYLSSGEAERQVAAGAAIRVVAVGGVLPTRRNVIRGNYPLTRPLSLVTRGLPAGAAKEFVNYCLSAKVVDLVEKFDLVPYEE